LLLLVRSVEAVPNSIHQHELPVNHEMMPLDGFKDRGKGLKTRGFAENKRNKTTKLIIGEILFARMMFPSISLLVLTPQLLLGSF
jgi:hypothetical protein